MALFLAPALALFSGVKAAFLPNCASSGAGAPYEEEILMIGLIIQLTLVENLLMSA